MSYELGTNPASHTTSKGNSLDGTCGHYRTTIHKTIGENKMNSLKILGSIAMLLVSVSAMAVTVGTDSVSVPEPATLGLLALGLAGLAAARRKR
jgi:hypothetical protein